MSFRFSFTGFHGLRIALLRTIRFSCVFALVSSSAFSKGWESGWMDFHKILCRIQRGGKAFGSAHGKNAEASFFFKDGFSIGKVGE